MPNRVLRDGLLSSETYSALSDDSQALYVRLLLIVDDYGRHEAAQNLLRAKCFPLLQERWPLERVNQAMSELVHGPIVLLYAAEGKMYIEVGNFRQRTRSMKSKCPAPAEDAWQTAVSRLTGGRRTHDGHLTVIRRTDDGHPRTEAEAETEAEKGFSPASAGGVLGVSSLFETPSNEPPPESESQDTSGSAGQMFVDRQQSWFDHFWDCFWRKEGKAEALKAFRKHVRTEQIYHQVLGALRAQYPGQSSRPMDKRKMAASWLNSLRWQDDPEDKPYVPDRDDLIAAYDNLLAAWPETNKRGTSEGEQAWEAAVDNRRIALDNIDKVFAGLELWKRSSEWIRDGSRYVPKIDGWILAERWNEHPAEATEHERIMAHAMSPEIVRRAHELLARSRN